VKKSSWIENCQICNAGLCSRVDAHREDGYKVREACKLMEDEANGAYTANQIRDRYNYYKGGGKPTSSHENTQSNQAYETRAETDLYRLVEANKKFGTIYIDPPWQYSNQATRASTDNHYQTMPVDEIAALPVGELATEKSHLHLWTTNAFLFECPKLLEAWGFEYKGVLVWAKNQMGIGNYWRVSHEFMILGVRGKLTFSDHSQMSWILTDRTKHSAKPDDVARRIETVSPGPYIELFARRTRENWTVWGNEIEKTMFNIEAFK
jgi:N6-adenosine-specific RNA methylase IME4